MKFSNKLALAILMTGVVVLILSAFTVYNFSYDSIVKSQLMVTKTIADEISGGIDLLLLEKVKTALTLANTPIIKKALETSNLSYANLSDEKRKESIKLLNEKWKSTKDPTDPFILKFTDNNVSIFLKNQQAILKGEYGEIFLTNKFGALLASTAKLSTLAHGHKYWWLGSYNNGEGAVFFDDRGYDDSAGGYVLGLVVPIRIGTEIIGILKCNLNILGSISELVAGTEDKSIGKFKLIRSGGMVVFEEGFEPLSTRVQGSILKNLESKNNNSFIINDSGEKTIVGCSEIKLTKGGKGYGFGGTFESIDHKKGNTGESWHVLCYRQMSVALAPATAVLKTIVWIGFSIIATLAFVSCLFGRKIANPLSELNKATEKIGKGDFEYRIDVRRKDEFGNVAHSFNSMASQLQQTTTSMELLENEVKHRKQTEEALRESEEKFAKAFHSNPAIVGLSDLETGEYIEVNQTFYEKLGFKPEEVIGKKVKGLLHMDSVWRKNTLGKLKKQGFLKNEETVIHSKNGAAVTVLFSAEIIELNNKKVNFTAAVDITERKQAEEQIAGLNGLRESLLGAESLNHKLKRITEGVVEIFQADFCRIWLIRPADRCNAGCPHAGATEGPNVCRHRERCLHLVAGSGRYTHIDGEMHRRLPFDGCRIGRVASGTEPSFFTTPHPYLLIALLAWPALRLGPRYVTISVVMLAGIAAGSEAVRCGPLLWGGDTGTERLILVQLYVGVVTLTGFLLTASYAEAKSSEQIAIEEQKRLTILGNNLPNGAVYQVEREHDGRRRFLYVSSGIERLTGLSAKEVLHDSGTLYRQIVEEDRQALEAAIEESEKDMSPFNVTVRFRRTDGQLRWMRASSSPRRFGDGRIIWDGIQIDITELKRATEELKQYAETQTVLLQEVNHRVKNNLVSIISMLHQVDNRVAQKSIPIKTKYMQGVIARIEGLLTVHSLLSARQWKPLDLSLLCKEIIAGTTKYMPTTQSVDFKVTSSDVPVSSDQAHYLAIVLNELALNSIKHGITDRNALHIQVSIDCKDNAIVLIYNDDGPGYPGAVLRREFSKGNIGFYLIQGIIEKSLRGHMTLLNNNGAMTRIIFPIMT